jgi:hypothetical protein
MRISKERLFAEAEATGFRPEILEKALQLLNLLENLCSHPFLKGRLALKGGTALNMFVFDLPRLSVDMDLNYIGAAEREAMLEDRPKVERGVEAVCRREGFTVARIPEEHAGGRWALRYESATGERGNLEVDLNFMFRVPLWPVTARDSRPLGSYRATAIPVLDIHELAAGKLAALLSRHASRDLFDVHLLLAQGNLDPQRLRMAFVVYGAMNRKDWRTVSAKDVGFEARELREQLVPMIRKDRPQVAKHIDRWAKTLVRECRQALDVVLPFTQTERAFLDRLLDDGQIDPALLTTDRDLAERITSQPLLEWKALNVRQHKGKA